MCNENEREVKMIEMELDLDEKTVNGLIAYAYENILRDKDALLNWACNDILKKVVETDGECLKEKVSNE